MKDEAQNNKEILLKYSIVWPGANFGILLSLLFIEIILKIYLNLC